VTGVARYSADQNLRGKLRAVFVAATFPAGRVSAIDAKPAIPRATISASTLCSKRRRHEPGVIVPENDYVIVHGCF
jgi:hypothetical protein